MLIFISLRSYHCFYHFRYPFAIVGINLTHLALNLLTRGHLKTHFYNSYNRLFKVEDFHKVYSESNMQTIVERHCTNRCLSVQVICSYRSISYGWSVSLSQWWNSVILKTSSRISWSRVWATRRLSSSGTHTSKHCKIIGLRGSTQEVDKCLAHCSSNLIKNLGTIGHKYSLIIS